MESVACPWSNWCRLCAKEDAENNVDIHYTDDEQPLTAVEDVNLTLKEALEKYFWVQSSCEDLLPQQLCSDCYSLISSVMRFNERVDRVQQMYKFLLENPMFDSCDLKSVRIKFDVSDDNRKQWWHSQYETKELTTENYQNTEENIESNLSEDEENDGVDNESVDLEEVLYDEDCFDNDSEEDDAFETMSDDNFWDEDEDKICPKATSNKDTSSRNEKSSDASTERTSENKRRRAEFVDINCMKKKKSTEDFVFYVACKECGQKFDLYSTYCEHMEESHGDLSTNKYCPICDRDLQTWYHLGRHMRVHMPLEYRKPVKCPECENRYTSSAQLEVHINHKHKNEKPFICEVCGFRGGTKHSLYQHMFMHTDNTPFECGVCKKKFKTRSRLNFHMDVHGPNKFVCAICGLQLNTRATLKNHMVVHSDEMRHKCDVCGKAFKRSKYLKNHLISHTGLKPYSCNFCGLTFSVRILCRIHMERKHPDKLGTMEASGSKAYSSNIPRLETLKAVVKDAANLKPIGRFGHGRFRCDFCEWKASTRQNCRVHMKRKHPNEFAAREASNTKARKKPTKVIQVDWLDFGKSGNCDFCDRKYANRRYCRAHIRRHHLDELTSMAASTNKSDTEHVPEVETTEEVTNSEENITTVQPVTKFSDCFTNLLQSMGKSKPPLDLTPSASTTTATNIQDYFVLID